MNNQSMDFSPMDCWDKAFDSHFHAGIFHAKSYRACFKEQEGCAVVQGRTIHYWLYDTASTHGGDNAPLHSEVLPAWVSRLGYVIVKDKIRESYPNTALAQTVRELMSEHGCNVSMALLDEPTHRPYALINEFIAAGNDYKFTQYPLLKKKRQSHSVTEREKVLCMS